MMKPFRERNPVMIGAVSMIVIALLVLGAFRASELPLIGGGDVYHAAFAEAGGLKAGDEVRIAGVRVGKVEKVELAGDHVRVSFRVDKGAEFGDKTGAAIKVKTLLGAMFLALEPSGAGQLGEGSEIPVTRTTPPYSVVEAFTGLAETSEQIDVDQLATSLETLTALTKNTPDEFQAALKGVSALSQNIAARDTEVNTLLKNLKKVSTVLDDRDQDILALMRDSSVLFKSVVKRRQAIHRLLVSTTTISKELSILVKQSRADLKPALLHLENVLKVLNKNQDNLDKSIRLMAPFYRVFANTLGNGPWFDTAIYNLPPIPAVR